MRRRKTDLCCEGAKNNKTKKVDFETEIDKKQKVTSIMNRIDPDKFQSSTKMEALVTKYLVSFDKNGSFV